MKKSVVLKGVLAVLFVFAAGIFYLCVAKGEGEHDEGAVLYQPEEPALGAVEPSPAVSFAADGVFQDSASKEGGEEEPEALVYVHVCGAVKEPGVYALKEGARVADAVLCAGDFLPGAARDYLNLAQPVFDGQKIYVPDEEEAKQLKEAGADAAPGGAQAPLAEFPYVNINTAKESELMTLPGIGKAKADAIVAYRKEHGAFSSCEELMQVPGIKESIYEKLRDEITVGE